jgi:hypothetical protein
MLLLKEFLRKLKDVLKMLHVFHEVESETQKFLSISAFAMKKKDFEKKSAESTLKAIEEYKKLPPKLKKELENDPSTHVSKIIELERLCREAVENGK